ncbi:disease resistance protein RGA5 [Aegilops tauschii subsp. strangulata]|uniref:disease resistance protein RGA5 n=1 Tax=Aegilops tauschii subsp. strangulata TaxID=200361 RepID=UPI003CC88CC1
MMKSNLLTSIKPDREKRISGTDRSRQPQNKKRASMVDVATGAMASLLPKLEMLLEHKLRKAVKEDAEQLLRELTNLHAALGNGSDPRWADDCRELSYHADDIVDAFLAASEPAACQDSCLGFLANFLGPRHRIANAIKDVKSQALNLADRYSSTDKDKLVPAAATTGASPHLRKEAEEPLVGVERGRDTLIKSLAGGQQMKIVSIVGSGGLGKTALANLVFRQLRQQFDSCAFVSVSSMPDMEGIFDQMLRQLNVGKNHNEEAKDAIRDFLQNRRYLIIVDDLWRKEDWHILSRSLPANACGSRVIVTTRVNDMAKTCCSGQDELICEIRHLDRLNSKILFLQRCFGSEASCPDALAREVGEILPICGGIPSAIISIASLLNSKIAARKPWQDVVYAFCSAWNEMASSLDSAQERISGLEDLIKVLSLSYENLPSTLKTCLLCIATSTTVKYQKFRRGDTVRKWITEGFISEVGWHSSEEVANQCFDDLVGNNVIQPVERPTFYGKGMYEVNCMMLYVLRLISREENLVTFLSDLNISETPAARPVFLSIRRCGSDGLNGTERLDLSHVRSITMIRCDKVFSFKHLGYLRVLNVEDCDGLDDTDVQHICRLILLKHLSLKETPQVTRLPPQIGNLRHLETLEIELIQISVLPPQIGKLQNLETLDVRLTRVKELPKELVQLPKLANLHFGHTGVRLPAGSDRFKSVKVLGTIDSRECSVSTLEEITGMTGLTKAEVMLYGEPADTPENDNLLSCMGKCTSLRSLIVHGDFITSDDLPASPNFPLLEKLTVTARFVKIPRWIAQLSRLKKLEIRLLEQRPDDLKILGGLPSLTSLAIQLFGDPRKQVTITSGFARLEFFAFDCYAPWVTFEQGAMPSLRHIELTHYSGPAGKMPAGIIYLESLQKVTLIYSSHCSSCAGVIETVAVMRKEAASHGNRIVLSVNGADEIFPSISSVDGKITTTENEEC